MPSTETIHPLTKFLGTQLLLSAQNSLVLPKPLNTGMWNGIQNVVPTRGPFNVVVFLKVNKK